MSQGNTRRIVTWLIAKYRIQKSRSRFRKCLASSKVYKLVVGSGGTRFSGWVPSEKDQINLLEDRDFAKYFQPATIDAILAEHVWEHLSYGEGVIAARNCHRYLKPGGYLRIAVPDGNHPLQDYIDSVKPGGSGLGSDDHKVLYTYLTLKNMLEEVGFSVKLLEYFTETGMFKFENWDISDGFIERSMRFDSRNIQIPLSYTSLIVDAKRNK